MGKLRIAYCIPCSYGMIPVEFLTSMLGMQKYMGDNYDCEQEFYGSRICYPDVARNELIDTVSKISDDAYALFLDVDQIYPPNTPASLIKIIMERGGVAQGFVRRRDNGCAMVYDFDSQGAALTASEERIAQEKGVKKIGGAGFGGVMMKVSTLRKFKQPVMKDYYDERGIHIGEDIAFFRECHNKNIPVWMDFDLKFPHLTTGAV